MPQTLVPDLCVILGPDLISAVPSLVVGSGEVISERDAADRGECGGQSRDSGEEVCLDTRLRSGKAEVIHRDLRGDAVEQRRDRIWVRSQL